MNGSWKAISLSAGLVLLAGLLLNLGCSTSGKTRFRFMNAVPDQQSLNVLVNPTATNVPVFSNVAYSTSSSYAVVASGSQPIEIEPSGTTTSLFNQSLTFAGGNDTTVVAANFSPSLKVLTFADNNSTPATNNFSLRLINVSVALGTTGPGVDIYIGQPTTPPLDITSINPTISGLSFGNASNYQTKGAGNWEIVVTAAGSKTPKADTGTLAFGSEQVRTFVFLDSQGGGQTYSLLSDLN